MCWTGAKPALVLTFADVQAAGDRAARAGGKDNHIENMLGLVDDFKLLALFLVELADKAVLGFLKFLNKVNRPRDVAKHLPDWRDLRGVSDISDRVSTQTTRRDSTKSTSVSSVAGRGSGDAAAVPAHDARQCRQTAPGAARRDSAGVGKVAHQFAFGLTYNATRCTRLDCIGYRGDRQAGKELR